MGEVVVADKSWSDYIKQGAIESSTFDNPIFVGKGLGLLIQNFPSRGAHIFLSFLNIDLVNYIICYKKHTEGK